MSNPNNATAQACANELADWQELQCKLDTLARERRILDAAHQYLLNNLVHAIAIHNMRVAGIFNGLQTWMYLDRYEDAVYEVVIDDVKIRGVFRHDYSGITFCKLRPDNTRSTVRWKFTPEDLLTLKITGAPKPQPKRKKAKLRTKTTKATTP